MNDLLNKIENISHAISELENTIAAEKEKYPQNLELTNLYAKVSGVQSELMELQEHANTYFESLSATRQIPIKFRGVSKETGELVYGGYIEGTDDNWQDAVFIVTGFVRQYPEYCEVEKGSVAQLAGYDIAGKELYEGDKVELTLNGGKKVEGVVKIQNCIYADLIRAAFGFTDTDEDDKYFSIDVAYNNYALSKKG